MNKFKSAHGRFRVKGLALTLAMVSGSALAGATIPIPDGSLSLGLGLRGSYQSIERGAPNGTSRSNDFVLDNAQLYFGGTWNKIFKATLNTDYNSSSNSLKLMDGILQFEPMSAFNVWLGRMLPASDRVNLEGPFYMTGWDYPYVSNYPSIFAGRDNGAQIWGKVMGDKLTYVLGAFKGHNSVAGGSNDSDNLLYAWRVSYAFLDPEPDPAYYLSSTYWGSNKVLTLGFSGNYESNGVGTSAKKANLTIWSADLLAETKLAGGGTPTFEAAYYHYDTGGIADCGTGEPGSAPCPAGNNVGGQVQGNAYYAALAYLFPAKVGYGQFQPFARYQKYNRDLSSTHKTQYDLGVNYVINGYSTKLTVQYSKVKDTQLAAPLNDIDKIFVGAQMVF